jgi:hypothetical protein
VLRGVPVAFGEATLLTGDMRYLDVVRRQLDNLFAARRIENGQLLLPHYYGEKDGKTGWYGYREGEFYPTGALGNLSDTTVGLYLWSLQASDLERILPNPPDRRSVQGWVEFLQGKNPDYPVKAMQEEFLQAARTAGRMRDQTGGYGPSPVAFESLVNLTLGGNNLYGSGDVLHSQVRYFDAERRRAGLAEDVAALVEKIEPDSVTLYLSNTSTVGTRRLIVQMGAYGEHQAVSVTAGGRTTRIDAPTFEVRLAPGAGEELKIAVKRYVNDPTLAFPWDRGWWNSQTPPPAARGRGAAAGSQPAGR